MNASQAVDHGSSWSWADLVSTYRFWGLLFFYTFAVAGIGYVINIMLPTAIRNTPGYTATQVSILYAVMAIFQVYGFFLAWLGARKSAKWVLVALTVAQFIAAFLLLNPDKDMTWTLRYIAGGIRGVASGAIVLLVPAIVAGGRGKAEVFVIGIGLMTLLNTATNYLNTYLIQFSLSPLLMIVILSVLGLIFLLPCKAVFFQAAPQRRGESFPPEERGALSTALKLFIPIYNIYWVYFWLYRAHGEVAYLAPARGILTPRAAVWGAFFVPILPFIAQISLADALNQRAAEDGRPPVISVWGVGIAGFFLNIVAMGLLQAAINRTAQAALQSAYPRVEPAPPLEL